MHPFAAALAVLATLPAASTPAPAPPPPAGPAAAAAPALAYPDTRRGDVVDDYFGTRVPDPYRWLEDDRSADTAAWVAAENAVTRAWLDQVPQRTAIRDRLTRLWDYERFAKARKKGGRYFWERNSGLQDQAVLHVAERVDGAPRVLLDPNALSKDGTVALSEYTVSEDGKLLAYATSDAGSDWLTWRVRRVDTGEDLPDELRWSKFATAAWLHDGSGFFYERFDPPKEGQAGTALNQNHQVWLHRIGTSQAEDRLVYARPDQPEWYFGADVTEDGRWLVITAWKGTNPESAVFLQDLSRPGAAVEPLLAEMDASYSVVHGEGDTFTVVTNAAAPRYRVVAIRRGAAAPASWRTLVPEGQGRDVLESAHVIGGRLLVTWMRDARSAADVWDLAGHRLRPIPLPALGSVSGFEGRADDPETFFEFTGFTTPRTVFRYDARSGKATLFKQPKVAFDPARFVTRQVFYRSKDGTRVPMFVVQAKGTKLDGKNPTLLYGYGGFNISETPEFSPARIAWLELGGVFALPNLRGGGEYGKAWYDAGRLANKQNVFDDFVAAAEWLIRNGYTTPARLAANGGSNGGLLVGAAMTQRPELFGAAVPEVGVLDMLRFHKFTVGWAWTSDYGSSDTKEGFEVLHRYSPLHAIRPGTRYPATMVLTADHDDRVVPAHSFKFVAALQAAQAGPAPILARIETRAGHGAGKPTSKRIDERADVFAFLVRALGMTLPERFPLPAPRAGGEG
jgi:prolyl oligopeptidase